MSRVLDVRRSEKGNLPINRVRGRSEQPMKKVKNATAISRAIEKLGGPTVAHKKIGVSYQALHAWHVQGFVRSIAHAAKISRLTGISLEDFARDAENLS